LEGHVIASLRQVVAELVEALSASAPLAMTWEVREIARLQWRKKRYEIDSS